VTKKIKIKRQNFVPFTESILTHSLSNDSTNGIKVSSRGYSANGERLHVNFPGSTVRAIKPENLRWPEGAYVYLKGLSHETLNGAHGKIISWLEEKQRYKVDLIGKNKSYDIKPINVVL